MSKTLNVCEACKRNFGASESYIKKHGYFCNECHEVPRMRKKARIREESLDYDSAMKIWDELGETKEAARVRRLKADQNTVKVEQTVIHGDQITKTEVKDSVLNHSNIGGGSSKMQELEKLTNLKREGLISEEEYEKMKQEIIG